MAELVNKGSCRGWAGASWSGGGGTHELGMGGDVEQTAAMEAAWYLGQRASPPEGSAQAQTGTMSEVRVYNRIEVLSQNGEEHEDDEDDATITPPPPEPAWEGRASACVHPAPSCCPGQCGGALEGRARCL